MNGRRRRRLGFALGLWALSFAATSARPVDVAAAANMVQVIDALAAGFKREQPDIELRFEHLRDPLALHGRCEREQRERIEDNDRPAGAVVQRQHRFQQPRADGREVEQHRRLLHERLVRERRDEPVATLEDVKHEPERVALVRLPWIATDRSGKQPQREQRENHPPVPGASLRHAGGNWIG